MKIKYFYLTLFTLSIIFIIYLSRTDKPKESKTTLMNNPHQNIPDDSIHQNIFKSVSPSKENVSEEFKKRLNELEKKFSHNPEDYKTGQELADLYLAAHQNEKAIYIYEKIKSQASLESLYNLTLAYYNIRNFNKAEETTRYILKKNPNEYKALFNLGSIKATMGQTKEAKKIWMELITKYPKTEEAKTAKEYLTKLK